MNKLARVTNKFRRLTLAPAWALAGALLAVQAGPLTQRASGQATQANEIMLTLPAGTKIQLTLVSTIKSKSTKVGDTVRGQVAFPVTVGERLAIPAGSYVEGMVTKLVASVKKKGGAQPDVEIHFTRLLFANGYAVSLDANSDEAALAVPTNQEVADSEENDPATRETNSNLGLGFLGQTPQPPPLPQVGPSKGAVIGGVTGGFAAATVGALLWAHHHNAGQDAVLRDAGWQFEMVTVSPLALDEARVQAAAKLGQ